MKSKTIARINIALLLLTLVVSDDNPRTFYKGKFFLFYPSEETVDVYEEYMIPYTTPISNVFIPKPEGNITRVYSPVKDKIIAIETSDGQTWFYERFKLRRVES